MCPNFSNFYGKTNSCELASCFWMIHKMIKYFRYDLGRAHLKSLEMLKVKDAAKCRPDVKDNSCPFHGSKSCRTECLPELQIRLNEDNLGIIFSNSP